MKGFFAIGVIPVITRGMFGGTTTMVTAQSESDFPGKGQKFTGQVGDIPAVKKFEQRRPAAPIAMVGDNIYIAWPTNQTGNDEAHLVIKFNPQAFKLAVNLI